MNQLLYDRLELHSCCNITAVKQKQNISLTLVSVLNQSLIDVMLFGVFQDVEETQVDSVRLFHDDVQQRLSGFDWTISQRLN